MGERIIEVESLSQYLRSLHTSLSLHTSGNTNAFTAFQGDTLRPAYERLMLKGAEFGVTYKQMNCLHARLDNYLGRYHPIENIIELPLDFSELEFYGFPVPSFNMLAYVLSHELGHARTIHALHPDGDFAHRRNEIPFVDEVCAESTSNLVLAVLGLDTTPHACSYMRACAGAKAEGVLDAYGAMILKAADELLN